MAGDISRRLADAEEHLRRGDLAAALDLYRDIASRAAVGDPTLAPSMIDVSTFRLAIERSVQLLEWQQDYQSALMLLEKASQDDPEFGEEHVLDRAQLLVRAGALSEGMRSPQECRRLGFWKRLGMARTGRDLCGPGSL